MSAGGDAGHLSLGQGVEFDAIRAMVAQWGSRATGIGDDAALIDLPLGERLVASTDASVEGVHFRREWLSAEEIGSRAAAAALSDLAAMAAQPLGLLLALAVPPDWDGELLELARGVGVAAERADCPIVGGNLSRASELSLTITVLGGAATPLRRSGARPGDLLFVTGRLGGPGAALTALRSGRVPAAAHLARFVTPVPRLHEARWLVQHGACAGIDISDGLLADAAHLARASGVTLALDLDGIPCVDGVAVTDAIASGEEYELLVAMPPDAALLPASFTDRFGVALSRVGVATSDDGAPVRLRDARVAPARGHDHFS